MRNPLPLISAAPLEDNIFEWHCNMSAPATSPYAGAVFHLIFYVPDNYPTMPPKVRIMTYLPHDHVFEEGNYASSQIHGKHSGRAFFICCNMLVSEWDGEQRAQKYRGWSPAYSIQSILIQLQAFLTSRSHNRYWTYYTGRPMRELATYMAAAKTMANNYSCSRCGHCGIHKAFPPLRSVAPVGEPSVSEDAKSESTAFTAVAESSKPVQPKPNKWVPADYTVPNYSTPETNAVKESLFIGVSDAVIKEICMFLNRAEQERVASTCKYLRRVVKVGMALHFAKQDLRCFFSKADFTQETLGLGVNVHEYPNGGFKSIEPTLDLISYRAFFEHGRRRSAINEKFQHFLPVYLSKNHGERAMKLAMAQFKDMAGSSEITDTVLKILPCLMNSMVVKTMEGQLHESIAALEGYVLFYHMLLAFAEAMPEIRKIVDERIAGFIHNEWGRSKDNVPNLGEFIACLAISNKYTWEDVREAYILESFDRQVRWFEHGHRFVVKMDPRRRIRLTAPNVLVSNRLCLFNVAFFRLFRAKRSASMTKRFLDTLYGRPTPEMVEALQRDVKRIRAISEMNVFRKFFEGVGLGQPSELLLEQLLRASVQNSRRRGYHGADAKRMRRQARAARFDPKPSPVTVASRANLKSLARRGDRLASKAVQLCRTGWTTTAPRGATASFAELLSNERSAARRVVRPAPRQIPRQIPRRAPRPVALNSRPTTQRNGGEYESPLLPGLRILLPARAPNRRNPQHRRRY